MGSRPEVPEPDAEGDIPRESGKPKLKPKKPGERTGGKEKTVPPIEDDDGDLWDNLPI